MADYIYENTSGATVRANVAEPNVYVSQRFPAGSINTPISKISTYLRVDGGNDTIYMSLLYGGVEVAKKTFPYTSAKAGHWITIESDTPLYPNGREVELRVGHISASSRTYFTHYRSTTNPPIAGSTFSWRNTYIGGKDTVIDNAVMLYRLYGPPEAEGPKPQRWDGTKWVPSTIMKWNGSLWAPTTLTRY